MKSLKRCCLSAVMLTLFLCSACQTGVNADGSALPDEEAASEITVVTLEGEDNYFEKAAKEFETATGIKVNVQNYYDNTSPDYGWSIYSEKVKAELVSKTGADVYFVSDLDYQNFGKKGLLRDVGDLIESDAGLTGDKVFMKILTGPEHNGAQFAIPADFYIDRLMINPDGELRQLNRLPQLDYKNLTWTQFFQATEDLPRKGALLNMYDTEIFMERFYAREKDFIDEDYKTNSLDSPEMISLLEEVGRWRKYGLCMDSRKAEGEYGGANAIYLYGRSARYTEYSVCEIPEELLSANPYYYLPSDFEQNRLEHDVKPGNLYAINASSSKQEIAWEFIKCLLSNKIQNRIVINLPVNKTIFMVKVKQTVDKLINPDVIINTAKMTDEAVEFVDQIEGVFISKPVYQIVEDAARGYFFGKLTAKQAANRMANKVSLHMKEQY